MADQRYITAQLIDFTLSGTLGDIDRNIVSGFIGGNAGITNGIFNGADIVVRTEYDAVNTDWYDVDRTNALASVAAFTTITLTDAVFKVPTTLFAAAGISEADATTALTNWIATIQAGGTTYVDVESRQASVAVNGRFDWASFTE